VVVKIFDRPQLLHLNTEMVINEVLVHFDREILLYFQRPFENLGPSKCLIKAPYTIILRLVP